MTDTQAQTAPERTMIYSDRAHLAPEEVWLTYSTFPGEAPTFEDECTPEEAATLKFKPVRYVRADARPVPADGMEGLARTLLEALDAFMSGQSLTEEQHEMQRAAALAGSFAAAAYEAAPSGGPDVHALTRTFLLALIDPDSQSLDYLRRDPASGAVAREASAAVRALAQKETGR